MDIAKWQFLLNLASFLMSLGAIVYAYRQGQSKAIKAKFQFVHTRIDDLEESKEALEKDITSKLNSYDTKLGNIPTHCTGHADVVKSLGENKDKGIQQDKVLTRIESDLKHLPTTDDIGKLHEKINGVRDQMAQLQSEVSKISGALPGLTHLTEKMDEYLLTNGSKK